MLNGFEAMFPSDFNFEGLSELCNDPRRASNDALLTYHLIDYFLQVVGQYFVSLHDYQGLEAQTQKL